MPPAPWTIGWGATGPGIGPETVWTQEECDERLARHLARYAAEVSAAIGDSPTSQCQFDALVSFHYNTGAIARASLTRLHIAGDYSAAAREFGRWKHAGGRVMRGLVRRRAEDTVSLREVIRLAAIGLDQGTRLGQECRPARLRFFLGRQPVGGGAR